MVASLDSLVDTRAFVQKALGHLRQAAETTNPALVLYLQLTRQDDLSPTELVRLEQALTEAMIVGEAEARAAAALVRMLRDLPPVPGPVVPIGF
jgi:hypothetical protein